MTLPRTEAMDAAIMLVGHTGAKTLEIGYLHDDVPSAEAAWWASAAYQGAKIQVEDHVGPVEAVEALAERLLEGALCQWCKGLVALHSGGAMAFPGTAMTDGSQMPDAPQDIAALGQCLWGASRRPLGARLPARQEHRTGRTEVPGCPSSAGPRVREVEDQGWLTC